jgi:hypothetical protein
VTDAGYIEAHCANGLFDAHRDDPELKAECRMSFRMKWEITQVTVAVTSR